jgi:hypothetical protein
VVHDRCHSYQQLNEFQGIALIPSYSKFENILPDELIQTKLKEELEIARDELKKIIKDDLENIKNLCLQHNKTIL